MNLLLSAPLWLELLLGCAMMAAAVEDAARFRISNITSVAILLGAMAAVIIEGPSWGLWQNLVVFIAMLVVGTGAFAAGLMGGGDVKLFAAAGLWFDVRSALAFVLLVFFAGGLVAIGYLIARPFRSNQAGKNDRRIPYGIAIAIGGLMMIAINLEYPHSHGGRAFSTLTAVRS